MKLQPTDTTQMVQPVELPMLKSDLPPVEESRRQGDKKEDRRQGGFRQKPKTDDIKTGSCGALIPFLSRIMVLKSKAHFSAGPRGFESEKGLTTFQGVRKTSGQQARSRIAIMIGAFTLVYAVIGGRLVYYGMTPPPEMVSSMIRPGKPGRLAPRHSRPKRRNPRHRRAHRVAVRRASQDRRSRRGGGASLHSAANLSIARESTRSSPPIPASSGCSAIDAQAAERNPVARIPASVSAARKRRFYPAGDAAAHVVGYVNIDNRGVAGMEKNPRQSGPRRPRRYRMTSTSELEPVKLSIDLRVQNIIHDEIKRGLTSSTPSRPAPWCSTSTPGEVLGMASAPDFDPNNPGETIDLKTKSGMNPCRGGVFEMGSTFKAFTTAMALDSGKVSMNEHVRPRKPLYIAASPFTTSTPPPHPLGARRVHSLLQHRFGAHWPTPSASKATANS